MKLKASNVILLSGTPVGGKYENLYSQLKLLGWNITKKEFWNNYINFEMVQYGGPLSPMIPKIKGYKNVDELKKMLKFYGADFLKSNEVFDSLPCDDRDSVPAYLSCDSKKVRAAAAFADSFRNAFNEHTGERDVSPGIVCGRSRGRVGSKGIRKRGSNAGAY